MHVAAVLAAAQTLRAIADDGDLRVDLERAAERGRFTPDEDTRLLDAFARYLTARNALREVLDELTPHARSHLENPRNRDTLTDFAIAYTAACLLVYGARTIVDHYATHAIIQRKLNEGDPAAGLPRKQYTGIYRALTDPRHAWRLSTARHVARTHRADLDTLRDHSEFVELLDLLAFVEPALDVPARRYIRARLRYRWHSWRRRHASAWQQGLFALLELGGRAVADVRFTRAPHRLPAHLDAIESLLRPGDVIISRHHHAASNLFLPGYWPHASLYVGDRPADLADASPACVHWAAPRRVLEAKKDGVKFRPLAETLTVDEATVLRPRLGEADINAAIARAARHAGKAYDFDFDFFRSDRLVCTEVVYRAYDGVGGVVFELTNRFGRPTLSAEDLISMALDGRGFEVAAWAGDAVVAGDDAATRLRSIRAASAIVATEDGLRP